MRSRYSIPDDWTPGSGLAKTGDRARWQVTLPANGTLRVCMAYTDLPARGLQNDLNLVVQRGGDVQKFIGNADLPDSLSQPDSQNNVELVRLDAATAGVYYIQVMVSDLLGGPQTFTPFVGGDGLTGFGPY
jgi:serine protease AprX